MDSLLIKQIIILLILIAVIVYIFVLREAKRTADNMLEEGLVDVRSRFASKVDEVHNLKSIIEDKDLIILERERNLKNKDLAIQGRDSIITGLQAVVDSYKNSGRQFSFTEEEAAILEKILLMAIKFKKEIEEFNKPDEPIARPEDVATVVGSVLNHKLNQ